MHMLLHSLSYMWHVITHPDPNFSGVVPKLSLNLGHNSIQPFYVDVIIPPGHKLRKRSTRELKYLTRAHTQKCHMAMVITWTCYKHTNTQCMRWYTADAMQLAGTKESSPSLPMTPWWRHQMETFYVLLAISAGNSPVPGEFSAQRPVTRSFDVFFDRRPNKRLSKQSWVCWF